MIRHRLRAACLAVVLTMAAGTAIVTSAPTAHAAAPSGTPIAIGSVETQTGAAGQTGKVTVATDALAAWAKWTNAHGGIAGHPVNVTVLNDRGDPAQASVDLKQLAEQDKVLAVVGEDAASTEPTWKSYIESQKLPVIGGEAYSANWFTSPYFYPVDTGSLATIWGQMFSAKNSGKTKVASLLCSNLSVCQLAVPLVTSAAKDQGMNIVFNQLADGNAVNYTPQCLAMKASGADVISPQGINNVTLIRDCNRQNYKPLVITTNYSYTLQQIKDTPQFEGLVGPSPAMSPYNEYPPTKDYFAALKKYAPDYAPGGKKFETGGMLVALSAWQAGQAFAKAVENANVGASATVTRDDVVRGLSMFKNETLGGSNPPLTYSDGTSPNPQVKCFYLYKIKGGKYVENTQGGTEKLYCQP